ncbi:Alpha/beta hydrolase fold-3 [Dillenia turbinata]|uniref:Alpha/beta hydrolase fold-3 n=1 Tax=Dillenia turbinata TaxID=194707 RepID=A0AAN8UUB2_9MAGN
MSLSDTKPDQPLSSSKLPLKTRISITLLSAMTDACRRDNGTINRRFLKLLDFRSPPSPVSPISGVTSSDVVVDSSRNLWFRIFTPTSTTDKLPVIIFFHGGGFAFLSPDSKAYDAVCRRFSRRVSALVVSVNYRLTPEHRYPSQYDDGFDVLRFLDENTILPESADLTRCFLAGDSAGANLAHQVAVRAGRSEFRNMKLKGLVSIQPFFGGEERTGSELRMPESPIVSTKRTDWLWKVFLPEGSDRDHEASNVSGPNAADISGIEYPKTLVFVAGLDPLQDRQRGYYEWLKRMGKEARLVEYPRTIHAFYVFPELPESSLLFTEVDEFINKECGHAT